MDIRQLRGIREALDGFVREFDDCIKTAPSREHFSTYVSGQLSDLDCKSIEPIALDALRRTMASRYHIEHLFREAKQGGQLLAPCREVILRNNNFCLSSSTAR